MNIYDKTSALLKYLASEVHVGRCLCELNNMAGKWMAENGVESTDYQYHPEWSASPFPGYICTSVNSTIVHGIPTKYLLREGDLVNIDVGMRDKETGDCGDSAMTLGVGEIANKDERLLRYAKRALYEGIKVVAPGVAVSEIGDAIQRFAWQRGYKVNKTFTGHGIGKKMHELPYIPHYSEISEGYKKGFSAILEEGQIICIEPMLTYGKDDTGAKHADGWSVLTRDGKNSAMFEHMVKVTKDGYQVLTTHFDESLYENR